MVILLESKRGEIDINLIFEKLTSNKQPLNINNQKFWMKNEN
jgi:hypothetical protein